MTEKAVPRSLYEYTAFLWPILITAVGGFWTWSQDSQADNRLKQERELALQAECFEQTKPAVQARLTLRKAEDTNLAVKDALREEFILAGIRAETACRAAGMETPIPLAKTIEAEARSLDDTDLRLAASVANPSPASSTESLATRPMRLYVQYSKTEDRAAAQALMDDSRTKKFDGRLISIPGIERVSRSPSRMELRCLTKADCDQAKRLAAWVAERLNRPDNDIQVVSLAATYEGRGATAGNYELWFPAS